MRRFFEEHRLDNDSLSKGRVNSIKRSVLARTEEDKPMKKHFKFKPLIIAAAAAATMAMSAVTVNALSSGDDALIKINGKTVDAYYSSYVEESGYTVEIYMVDYPEEVLINPPKDVPPEPVGEMKLADEYNVSDDYIELVDEEGNRFPLGRGSGSVWTFGKYVMVCITKTDENGRMTGYSYGCNGGGEKEEYGTDIYYDPNSKTLSVEFHKNLFDTIGDIFKGE